MARERTVHRRFLRDTVAILATIVALTSSRAADAADPREEKLAQALFDEGRALMNEGRYAEACPKLAESQRLDAGGGTLLNLALCLEGEEKLATAAARFEEALRQAIKDGRVDRQRLAREHLASLETAMPKLTVVVSAEAAMVSGLEVRLDGLLLGREAWGVAMPVDPGAHTVQASAERREPWSSTIRVTKAEKARVTVPAPGPAVLATLPADGEPVAVGIPFGPGVRKAETEGSDEPMDLEGYSFASPPPRRNPVFVAAAGTAVATGALSAITGVVALVAYGEAMSGCLPERSYCRDDDARGAADLSRTMAWISTVSAGVMVGSAIVALAVPVELPVVRPTAAATEGGAAFGVAGRF